MRAWRGWSGRSAGGCCSGRAGGRRCWRPTPPAQLPEPLAPRAVPRRRHRHARRRLHLQRHRRPRPRRAGRAHPLAADPERAGHASGRRRYSRRRRRWSAWSVLVQFNGFTVALGVAVAGDHRRLSVPEAHHLVAAGRSRHRVFVGRADGLGGGLRPPRLAAGAALRRRDPVDDRLRHDLRPPGQGGRRAGRRPLDGAPFRRDARKPLLSLFYAGATLFFTAAHFFAGRRASSPTLGLLARRVASRSGRRARSTSTIPTIA